MSSVNRGAGEPMRPRNSQTPFRWLMIVGLLAAPICIFGVAGLCIGIAVKALDSKTDRKSPGSVANDSGAVSMTSLNSSPPVAKAPFDAAQARAFQDAWARHLGTTVETTHKSGIRFILLPPGEFLMGSGASEIDAALKLAREIDLPLAFTSDLRDFEGPQHRVV